MTSVQIDLARYALGLPNTRRISYRNHFVTGPGSDDHPHWLAMVERGYARRRDGGLFSGGNDVFWLTTSGATRALKPGERLHPETFPQEGE